MATAVRKSRKKVDRNATPRVRPEPLKPVDRTITLYKCACDHNCRVLVWKDNTNCSLCMDGVHQ